MGKYKSDYDRLETVKEFKVSKLSIRAFAIKKGMSRETLRDWVNAYDNVDGSFVKLNKVMDASDDGALLSNDNVVNEAIQYIRNADCLIIGGTFLSVYPTAQLIHYFHDSYLIGINKENLGTPYFIQGPIDEVFKQIKFKK